MRLINISVLHEMLRNILKYDYCLAEWFVPKKRVMGIEPMVSFIFLGKLVFLFLPIYALLETFLSFELSTFAFMTGLIISLIALTYGLQKPIWKLIKDYELKKEYKRLSKGEKRKRNFIGLSLVIIVYFGSFYVLLTKVLIWQ